MSVWWFLRALIAAFSRLFSRRSRRIIFVPLRTRRITVYFSVFTPFFIRGLVFFLGDKMGGGVKNEKCKIARRARNGGAGEERKLQNRPACARRTCARS